MVSKILPEIFRDIGDGALADTGPNRPRSLKKYSGAPYRAPTTDKSLAVPSCGGRYHAPSIPIDLHLESNRAPGWLLIGTIVADVAAQLAAGKPAIVTV